MSITDTPAFRRWFRDSKVVDKKGQPLVVYHGAPDVRAFWQPMGWAKDSQRRSILVPASETVARAYGPGFTTSPSRGNVFFATDSRLVANSYTDPHRAFDYQGAEPGVIPLYLSIQNPYVIDAKGKEWRNTTKQIEPAFQRGHDGVIILNSVDYYVNDARSKSATVYVFFDPRQAKSALTAPMRSRNWDAGQRGEIPGSGPNRGTFDPESADLRANPIDYLNPRRRR